MDKPAEQEPTKPEPIELVFMGNGYTLFLCIVFHNAGKE